MFCLWWHNWRQQRIIINPLFSGQMEIIKLNKKTDVSGVLLSIFIILQLYLETFVSSWWLCDTVTLEKNFKESSILIRGGVCQYPQPQSRWYGQTTQDYKDKDKYFPISVTSLINLFSFAKYETLYDFDIVLIKADGSKKSEEGGFSREVEDIWEQETHSGEKSRELKDICEG